MLRRLALAAIAVALLAPFGASAASLGFCFGNPLFCRDNPDPFEREREQTRFDLGVDISNVPLTRTGVGAFLATLSPQGQQIMVRTCDGELLADLLQRVVGVHADASAPSERALHGGAQNSFGNPAWRSIALAVCRLGM